MTKYPDPDLMDGIISMCFLCDVIVRVYVVFGLQGLTESKAYTHNVALRVVK